ncbi:hypothetical protein AB3N59_10500 [Leptospira sp. WS92.C1]
METEFSVFNKANTNTYVSYIRRSFGSFDDPRNRIDIIIANENSTDIIPTNVPMSGGQYATLIGYGYVPANVIHRYSFLFRVENLGFGGTTQYYFWSGTALPLAGSRMIFTEIFPAIAGESILSYQPFNAGGGIEKGVFCEYLPPSGPGTCYSVDGDFTNRTLIAGPPPTGCTFLAINGAGGGWCYDEILTPNLPFYFTNGTAAAFTTQNVDLSASANYGVAPYNLYPSVTNFDVQPDFQESHFVENETGAIRITTATGDLTTLGVIVGTNANQQTFALSGIQPTDNIYLVRSVSFPPTTYLSFLMTTATPGEYVPHLYRSIDTGANWAPVNLASLPLLPPSGFFGDPTPFHNMTLGNFITNSGTEKLHYFANIEGDAFRRYVSMDNGTTWTLQETIPLSPE